MPIDTHKYKYSTLVPEIASLCPSPVPHSEAISGFLQTPKIAARGLRTQNYRYPLEKLAVKDQ